MIYSTALELTSKFQEPCNSKYYYYKQRYYQPQQSVIFTKAFYFEKVLNYQHQFPTSLACASGGWVAAVRRLIPSQVGRGGWQSRNWIPQRLEVPAGCRQPGGASPGNLCWENGFQMAPLSVLQGDKGWEALMGYNYLCYSTVKSFVVFWI